MFEDSASTMDYELEDDTDTDVVAEQPGLTDSQTVRLEAEVTAEIPTAASDPGLGLMLELAKRGEYDPWNIDIVTLTDRYLEALDEQLSAQELGAVARLIFYAAALIHLKARALAEHEAQIKAAEDAVLLEECFDDMGEFDAISRLRPGDMPLVYPDFMTGEGPRGGINLAPRERPPRKRGVTLVDLISALRTYDERLALKEAELTEEPIWDGEMAFQECVEGSHQDDLDQDLITVRQDLWDRLPEGGSVTVSDLVRPGRNKQAVYLALLFLAQDEEVFLEQDDFYGEVRVVRGPYFGEIRAGVHERDDDEAPPSADSEDGDESLELEQASEEADEETQELADVGDEEGEDVSLVSPASGLEEEQQ